MKWNNDPPFVGMPEEDTKKKAPWDDQEHDRYFLTKICLLLSIQTLILRFYVIFCRCRYQRKWIIKSSFIDYFVR